MTNLMKYWCVKPNTISTFFCYFSFKIFLYAISAVIFWKKVKVKVTKMHKKTLANLKFDQPYEILMRYTKCHFNLCEGLLVFSTSVVKMIFMFLIICASSITNGQELPDQKFVTDLVTKFNRFGIIYHLPQMKVSHVHDYFKSVNQYKWVREKNYVWLRLKNINL